MINFNSKIFVAGHNGLVGSAVVRQLKKKGYKINGIDDVKEALVFHSGTLLRGSEVITNGGRVITLTGLGNSMQEALKKSYNGLDKIEFKKMYFRRDIGFDL